MKNSLKSFLEPKESDIEKTMLDYLNTVRGGFVCKMNRSGRPVRRGNIVILIPFKNIHAQWSITDIQLSLIHI